MTRSFGARVRAERLRRGWTQAKLAQRVGVKSDTISQLERGLRRPWPRVAVWVVQALGLEDGLETYAETYAGDSALKLRRLALGWSLQDTADRAGVDRSTVWLAERHDDKPKARTVEKIERALCRGELAQGGVW